MMGIAKRGLGRRSSAIVALQAVRQGGEHASWETLSSTAVPDIAGLPLARRRLAAVIFREDL